MTSDEVKASLAKAARRAWPNVTRARDLPFPEYWKAVTEWLTFHAPRVGDALMLQFIDDFVADAKAAEERGLTPAAPKVSKEVREIWRKVARNNAAKPDAEAKADEKMSAWEHAAERAADVKCRFATRANAVQRRLL